MRIAPCLLAGMFLGAVAQAAGPEKPIPDASRRAPAKANAVKPDAERLIRFTPEETARLASIEERAWERLPKRRGDPLRYANISDNEVREIEQLATGLRMPQLVNISPVVTGCPCEEGGDCTEQVYVIAKYQGKNVGLQFSRMKNRWNIGRVQRWWLDYAALLAREDVMEKRVYQQAHARMLLEFPMCPSGTTLDRTASTAAASTAVGKQ